MSTSLEPQFATPTDGFAVTSEASGNLPTGQSQLRRHDLDALRAVAMLLGIALHAALSFAPTPWSVKDTQQSEGFYLFFAAIHGFRMPLFFMLSGYFTAMLWRKRGLGGLIKQRLTRVALPLLVGCFTIVPAMWVVGIFVSRPSSSPGAHNQAVWDAVVAGDTNRVRTALETSEIEIDTVSRDGAPLLTAAVFLGHTDMAQMLIEMGSDVNQRNGDQGTPLHTAAFMGRAEEAAMLLQAGVDPAALNSNGQTAKDLLTLDYATTNMIASSFGLAVDETSLAAGRTEIARQLGVQNYEFGNPSGGAGSGWRLAQALLFQLPVFMHLWFLWFLCWLVAAFAIYAWIVDTLRIQKLSKWWIASPVALLWLVPLTMLPQSWMAQATYGPDTSVGLLPLPSVLAYYAIFFFFGAFYWDSDDTDGRLGKWWMIYLPLALLIIFPVGFELVSGTFGTALLRGNPGIKLFTSNLLQALFAWLMTFGLIGLFQRYLSRESKWMRYLSDSAYWLYLVHLPLVILAQWLVRDMPLPAWLKFMGVTIVVSAVLLLTYEYLVRHTLIGRILNGPQPKGPFKEVPAHNSQQVVRV